MRVERVRQEAGDHHLGAKPLRGVGGPHVGAVIQFRTHRPAVEEHDRLVDLKVLPLLDRLGVPKTVGVGRVQRSLIQVAHVGVETDVQVPLLGVGNLEAAAGRVRAEPLTARGPFAERELGAAAVPHPDALLVEAPGRTQFAGHCSSGSHERDAFCRVGRTGLSLARLRAAHHGHGRDPRAARRPAQVIPVATTNTLARSTSRVIKTIQCLSVSEADRGQYDRPVTWSSCRFPTCAFAASRRSTTRS